jgi:hypothetical protein
MLFSERFGHTSLFSLRLAALAGLTLLTTVSCAPRASGKGLLPRPPAANVQAAPDQPEQGFQAQSDGALVRRVYRSDDAAAAVRAEVLDVLVPPGKTTTLKYDGLVVGEAREGSSAATLVEKNLTLDNGVTFGLSQGEAARVENKGKEPVLLRVYVVTVR